MPPLAMGMPGMPGMPPMSPMMMNPFWPMLPPSGMPGYPSPQPGMGLPHGMGGLPRGMLPGMRPDGGVFDRSSGNDVNESLNSDDSFSKEEGGDQHVCKLCDFKSGNSEALCLHFLQVSTHLH